MTFNHLSSNEPAFISNEKFSHSRQAARGLHKGLADCCYSFANLALIIAGLVALVFAVNFFYDDPLYDYGEHLLSLRFYRQLIFVLVVLALALVVPLFNAVSACFLPHRRERKAGSLTSTKMIYEVVMAVLVFIGLAFVAPFIRSTSVQTQLAHELRRHMKFRYDNDFSYTLVDKIQEEYGCCDEPWYRANFGERLPISCFKPDGSYTAVVERNCADVIGSVVANRCAMLAACLMAMLVALCILLAIDLVEMLANAGPGRHYDVGARETKLAAANEGSQLSRAGSANSLRDATATRPKEAILPRGEEDDDEVKDSLLKSPGNRPSTPAVDYEDDYGDARPLDPYNSRAPVYSPTTAPILTRANYLPGLRHSPRPQSPLFVGADASGANQPGLGGGAPRGVLKKAPIQSIDTSATSDSSSQSDVSICDSRSRQTSSLRTPRGSPTRRSQQSVRFAND